MKFKILLISIVFFLKFKSFGNIYFVDGDKTDDNGNGSSWVTAKKSLSSALFLSQNGDEIWVKNGIYYPSVTYQGYVNTFKPREHTFYVKDGTKIYGGFNGTENYIQERDLTQNSTILSGDIGLPGVFSDNCYHVISAFALNGIGITMDGLIVEKGNANFVSLNYFFLLIMNLI